MLPASPPDEINLLSTAAREQNVGSGSKGEILAASRCFPLFARYRTFGASARRACRKRAASPLKLLYCPDATERSPIERSLGSAVAVASCGPGSSQPERDLRQALICSRSRRALAPASAFRGASADCGIEVFRHVRPRDRPGGRVPDESSTSRRSGHAPRRRARHKWRLVSGLRAMVNLTAALSWQRRIRAKE